MNKEEEEEEKFDKIANAALIAVVTFTLLLCTIVVGYKLYNRLEDTHTIHYSNGSQEIVKVKYTLEWMPGGNCVVFDTSYRCGVDSVVEIRK